MKQRLSIVSLLQDHALGLLGGWLLRARSEGWLKFKQGDGGLIWPEEIEKLLISQSHVMMGRTLQISTHLSIDQCWGNFSSRLKNLLESGIDPVIDQWFDFIKRLDLKQAEIQTLALLMTLNLDQSLARSWRYAWANVMQVAPSWGFIVKLLSTSGNFNSVAKTLSPTHSSLFKLGLITLGREPQGTPLSERTLGLAPEILPILLGWDFEKSSLRTFEEISFPPSRLSKNLRPRLRKLIQSPGPLRGVVYGPEGSGRLAILAQIAQGIGTRQGLWILDIGRAVAQGKGEEKIMEARRMSALLDIVVVIVGLDRLETEERRWVETLEDVFESSALLWMLDAPPPAYFRVDPSVVLGVCYPPKEERLEVWTEALSNNNLSSSTLGQLAGQYLLSEGNRSPLPLRVELKRWLR